jgi:hypothetical protein
MAKKRRYRGSCFHCGEYRQITLRWKGGTAICFNCAAPGDYKKRGLCVCCQLSGVPLEDDHYLGRTLHDRLKLNSTMPLCLNCHKYVSKIKLPLMMEQRKFLEQTECGKRRVRFEEEVTLSDIVSAIVCSAHAFFESRKNARRPDDAQFTA